MSSLDPGAPLRPALPRACISTLRFDGIKLTITWKPPYFTNSYVAFKSIPLPATFVATIIYFGPN